MTHYYITIVVLLLAFLHISSYLFFLQSLCKKVGIFLFQSDEAIDNTEHFIMSFFCF